MRGSLTEWIKRWDIQVWMLLLSPLPLVGILLIVNLGLSEEAALLWIAIIWTVVALGAVGISCLLGTKAFAAWNFAYANYETEDSRRLVALVNLIGAFGLFSVHLLFLLVGFATLFLTGDQWFYLRQIFSRIDLVTAQYILLVIGIVSFVIHRKIRQRISRQINGELGEEEKDE